MYCGSNGVLSIEVPLYRTVYCGSNGVLSIEVPLYRTVYCGPNGVLSIEVPLYKHVQMKIKIYKTPQIFHNFHVNDSKFPPLST